MRAGKQYADRRSLGWQVFPGFTSINALRAEGPQLSDFKDINIACHAVA